MSKDSCAKIEGVVVGIRRERAEITRLDLDTRLPRGEGVSTHFVRRHLGSVSPSAPQRPPPPAPPPHTSSRAPSAAR
jgi:hypothetical protein